MHCRKEDVLDETKFEGDGRLHNKGDSCSRENKLKLLEMLRHLSPISLKTLITYTGFKRNELEHLIIIKKFRNIIEANRRQRQR